MTKDKFKSNLEREVFKGLQALKGTRKYKVSYEIDEIDYVLTRSYIPDFTVEFKDGRVMFIEAKGFLRPEDRQKMIAVKEQYPEHDIRLIFERDNKLSRNSKMRYSDWATRHGFPFSIGTIPEDWFQ